MVRQSGEYAIETFSLTKIFPDWWGRAKVTAVEDLCLKVRHNEIYGFLGPNGSGKTTTLKMLLNLLHPSSGSAVVLGGVAADSSISARLGYLPEDSYLYPYLSARETLDFYGRLFGFSGSVRKSRIDALLEMVGLTGMANRPIGTFSKGMARRIGLAQALINDPELLILDEPTSGMDPIGTRQIKDLLVRLAGRGKTILLCSHLLADVEDVCDRIGILYGGRMQVEGDVGELLRHSDRKQIVTGPISESALAQIRQIVQAEQADCQISSPMDRLEQFFVRTVAKAQKEKKTTSGAVSTTSITGFLAEEASDERQRVLDSLVTAPVGPLVDSMVQGDAGLETVEPEIDKLSQPQEDRALLGSLAGGNIELVTPHEATDRHETPGETGRSETRHDKSKPGESTPDEIKTTDQIRQDLLNLLTGPARPGGDSTTEPIRRENSDERQNSREDENA